MEGEEGGGLEPNSMSFQTRGSPLSTLTLRALHTSHTFYCPTLEKYYKEEEK